MLDTFASSRFARISFATLALAGTALAGNVITVAAVGPADFAQIQPAIDAAQPDDTILVRSGSYAPFTVSGIGINVVADVGADVVILGTIRVQDIWTNLPVVLSGLRTDPPQLVGSGVGLIVQSNSGDVRLFDCEFAGRTGADATCADTLGASGNDAVQITGFVHVAVSNCILRAGDGGDMPCDSAQAAGGGGKGLSSIGPTVVAYSTSIRAGDAGDGGDFPVAGNYGVALGSVSKLFLCDSTVRGGDGSDTSPNDCYFPGAGGAAIYVPTATSVQRMSGTLTGGLGGTNAFCGAHAADGPALLGGGSTATVGLTSVGLDAPRVAREGQSVLLTFHGSPGESVYVFESELPAFDYVPSWHGYMLVSLPWGLKRWRKFGPIPASGTLTRAYPVGSLPSGVQSSLRYVQAFRSNGLGITLGTFVPLVVVDAAF